MGQLSLNKAWRDMQPARPTWNERADDEMKDHEAHVGDGPSDALLVGRHLGLGQVGVPPSRLCKLGESVRSRTLETKDLGNLGSRNRK